MRIDGLAEEVGSENKDEMKDEAKDEESELGDFKTSTKGIGMGATTSRTPSGLVSGLSAGGGGGAVTKKVVISD